MKPVRRGEGALADPSPHRHDGPMNDSTTPSRRILASDRVAPEAARQISAFHRDFVDEVKAAVERDHVVVVGMGQNPVVGKAHKALTQAGIPFTRIDHGSYLSGYRRRLAIKMWSGFPTFPQVFVDGQLIGGFTELAKILADGGLKA
jgi:glutaredoxin-related protein